MLSKSILFRKKLNGLGSLPGAGEFSGNEPGSGDSKCGEFSRVELADIGFELSQFTGKSPAFEIIRKSRKFTKFITESEIVN